MAKYPEALENLIQSLTKLSGIGRRGAERMAFGLLKQSPDIASQIASALSELHEQLSTCEHCGFFQENGNCLMCSDDDRNSSLICVVEDPMDVFAFENSGGYSGLYHVLGGSLSPLKGVTPSDLSFDRLLERINESNIEEVIIAMSPNVEGDATALYLHELLEELKVSVTQIGRGVPLGGNLEYADSGTLRLALETRRPYH